MLKYQLVRMTRISGGRLCALMTSQGTVKSEAAKSSRPRRILGKLKRRHVAQRLQQGLLSG